MAVTLYRQIGKGKAPRYQKVNLGRWAPSRRSHRSLFPAALARRRQPVLRNTLVMTPMKQSPPVSASRHISKLLMRMSRSLRTKTKLVGRNHGRRVPVVRRASPLSGQKPTGKEREDAAGIQLPPRILPRLHRAETALPRPD